MERMTSPNIDDINTAILEKTLALIKPDGMQYRDAILKRIRTAGFSILQKRFVKLTPEQASEFYNSKCDNPNYPLMVITLTEGPIMAMCLSKLAAIKEWKALMGPESYNDAKFYWPGSLRAEFADPNDEFKNAVHGSDNADSAKYEIKFFFPNMIIEPVLSPTEYKNYLQAHINPILMEGLYKMTKIKPLEPIEWLAEYLYLHNPNKPEIYNTDDVVYHKICQLQEEERERLKSEDKEEMDDCHNDCYCDIESPPLPLKNEPIDNCGLTEPGDTPSACSDTTNSCVLVDDIVCPSCNKPFVLNNTEPNSQMGGTADSICGCHPKPIVVQESCFSSCPL